MGNYLKLFENHNEYTAFTQTEEFVKPNVSHCIEGNEVHYNPLPNANGHAYVDLGLPSGTLWATMNVGATNETDYGLYFSWGDTTGYTAAQVGTDKNFSWTDYELGDGQSGAEHMTKYNSIDGKTVLEIEDDAARVNWGGDWKMPTNAQFEELTANTTSAWDSARSGYTFTANGNTLFFPAAGYCYNGSVSYVGSNGYCWSSSLGGENKDYAWGLGFLSRGVGASRYYRCSGYSVRGVLNQ